MSSDCGKTYDDNNVFAKILRGDLSTNKIYEDENVLCFKDLNPVARIHVLIIPKGKYVDYDDFITNAPDERILEFFKTIKKIVKEIGIKEYRLVTNCGKSAGQIIFHFHVHLIAN